MTNCAVLTVAKSYHRYGRTAVGGTSIVAEAMRTAVGSRKLLMTVHRQY
jgi:hypothetical protein